jgi:excisionase family DNA binding protein
MDPKFIGRYRHGEIRISGSRHIPPPAYEIEPQMNQLLFDLNNNPEEYTTVELAAMVLHKLVYIHPFQDGNGRIARLLTNLMLMKKRYPQIIIPRSDRSKYLNYLEKADQGNHRPIANFVGQYVLKHLDLFLRALEQKPADRMLTLEQAAKLTSYSPGYLRLLANKGLIMAVKEGRNWRVHESEIREYVKTHPKSSANAQSKKYPAP